MKMRTVILLLVTLIFITQINSPLLSQVKSKKDKATKQEKVEKKIKSTDKSDDEAIGKTKDGKTVFAGPKGGFYYLTPSGNKAYIDETEVLGIKVVGKTKEGKSIYEGPRGGRFYYSEGGEKVYLKK